MKIFLFVLPVFFFGLTCSHGSCQEIVPDDLSGTTILVKDKDGVMVERPVYNDPATARWAEKGALKLTLSELEKLGLVDVAKYMSPEQLAAQVDLELTPSQQKSIAAISKKIRETETNGDIDELERLKFQIQLLKQLKAVFISDQLKSISERAQAMRLKRFYSKSLYSGYGRMIALTDKQKQTIERRCEELNDELREAREKIAAIEKKAKSKYIEIFDEVYTTEQKDFIESRISFKLFTSEMSLKDLISDTSVRRKD